MSDAPFEYACRLCGWQYQTINGLWGHIPVHGVDQATYGTLVAAERERDAAQVEAAELRKVASDTHNPRSQFGLCWCWYAEPHTGLGHGAACKRIRALLARPSSTRGQAILTAFAQAVEAVGHLLETYNPDGLDDPGPGIRTDLERWRALGVTGEEAG